MAKRGIYGFPWLCTWMALSDISVFAGAALGHDERRAENCSHLCGQDMMAMFGAGKGPPQKCVKSW